MTKPQRIFFHPQQEQMQVEVILASKPAGDDHRPIYTIRFRYPRPIHGEIMTHRVFGRNARSSRAVPVRTMLNEVRTIPYVPWHWGKNQSGMQASEECNELISLATETGGIADFRREEAWLKARDAAADAAEAFMNSGYHKQNPNRLLEPFSWIDTLITSTEWDNFLWLRDHKDAEPHLQDLARLLKQAMDHYQVRALPEGDWHLPYITDADWIAADEYSEKTGVTVEEFLLMVSAARCARISYKPFDGDASYGKELDRYNQLVTSDRVHASPLEHQGKADAMVGLVSRGSAYGVPGTMEKIWANPHLHGNLTGYIQARKLVPNEVYASN